MKNTALNTLTYTGIVTLSRYVGSKKVKISQTHNTGGAPLFDFLADCLCGDFDIAKAKQPAKIKILKQILGEPDVITGKRDYQYEEASHFIKLLTKPEKKQSATQSYVRYSFMVPRDIVEGLTNYESLGIGLYTNSVPDNATTADLANFAAFVLLEAEQTALANTALVVDWDLVISNVAATGNTSGARRV